MDKDGGDKANPPAKSVLSPFVENSRTIFVKSLSCLPWAWWRELEQVQASLTPFQFLPVVCDKYLGPSWYAT